MPVIRRTDDLEFQLASDIAGMTTDVKKRVAFVTGFQTKGPYDIQGLGESLTDRYELRSLDLSGDSVKPIDRDSTSVLVVAAPGQMLDSLAVRRIAQYVDSGGAALFLLNPVTLSQQSPMPVPVHTGLEDFLSARGVGISPKLVFDLASNERVSLGRRGLFNVVAPYPLWPVVRPAGDSPVTQGIDALTLAWAGPIDIKDTTRVFPLLETSQAGGVRPATSSIQPDQDWDKVPRSDLGVRVVAAAVDPGPDAAAGRMVVVDDANFVEGQFLQNNPQNLTFVANAVDWLTQDESLIRIRSKDRTPPSLVFASDLGRNALKWGNLVGMPLLFILGGLLWVSGRRRRAEARWEEVVS
jgi:ABC-type uncharacterized transport system involved in gliding motility auxiliary subunit